MRRFALSRFAFAPVAAPCRGMDSGPASGAGTRGDRSRLAITLAIPPARRPSPLAPAGVPVTSAAGRRIEVAGSASPENAHTAERTLAKDYAATASAESSSANRSGAIGLPNR